MGKIELRIDIEGVVHTDSRERLAGQVFCEISGKEDRCDGSCCDEPSDDQEVFHPIDRDNARGAREKVSKEPIRIRITREGAAYPEWWTPGSSQILCAVCGKNREECLRISKGGMFLSCPNINPNCG